MEKAESFVGKYQGTDSNKKIAVNYTIKYPFDHSGKITAGIHR